MKARLLRKVMALLERRIWFNILKKGVHVSQPPLAKYGSPLPCSHLKEGCLAALAHWVDAVLVEAAGGGDGSVVVDSLAAVDRPVVVAVVVDGAVPVKHEAVLTDLLVESSWGGRLSFLV